MTTKESQLCRFFQSKQGCARGTSCRYRHDNTEFSKRHIKPGIVDVCRYFTSGACNRGEDCPYSHAPISHVSPGSSSKNASLKALVSRELSGWNVEFGDGMDISLLRHDEEPLGKDLTGRMNKPDEGQLQVSRHKSELPGCSAIISFVKDAEKMCLIWDSSGRTKQAKKDANICLAMLEKKESRNYFHFGKPAVRIHLLKPSNRNWSRAIEILEKGGIPTKPKYAILLTIKNLRPGLDPKKMKQILSGSASWNVLEHATPPYSQDALITAVMETMNGLIPAERVSLIPTDNSSLVRINARYPDPDDVDTMISMYSGRFLTNPNGRQMIKLKIERNVVGVVQLRQEILEVLPNMMKQLIRYLSDVKIQVKPADHVRKLVNIYISSPKSSKVAAAKRELVNMSRGHVAINDGQNLWSPLLFREPVQKKMEEIMKESGTFIMAHRCERCIRVYGGPTQRTHAYKLLVALLRDIEPKREFRVRVTALESQSFMQQSHEILSQLSQDAFRIETQDKATVLVFEVKPSEFAQLRKSVTPSEDPDGICPICLSTPEDPIQLKCSHAYCKDCFFGQCEAASQGTDFPMTCMAGKCNAIIPINIIIDTIPSAMFDTLCRVAFTEFIRSKPNKYRHCPTPGCDFVFIPHLPSHFGLEPESLPPAHPNARFNVNGWPLSAMNDTDMMVNISDIVCPECFDKICPRCCLPSHRAAETSCFDAMDREDGGDQVLKRYLELNDYRPCPRCRVPGQKDDGCNHVVCGSCGAHVCWFKNCLKIFENGDQVYAHMLHTHGSQGGNDAPQAEVALRVEADGEVREVDGREWGVTTEMVVDGDDDDVADRDDGADRRPLLGLADFRVAVVPMRIEEQFAHLFAEAEARRVRRAPPPPPPPPAAVPPPPPPPPAQAAALAGQNMDRADAMLIDQNERMAEMVNNLIADDALVWNWNQLALPPNLRRPVDDDRNGRFRINMDALDFGDPVFAAGPVFDGLPRININIDNNNNNNNNAADERWEADELAFIVGANPQPMNAERDGKREGMIAMIQIKEPGPAPNGEGPGYVKTYTRNQPAPCGGGAASSSGRKGREGARNGGEEAAATAAGGRWESVPVVERVRREARDVVMGAPVSGGRVSRRARAGGRDLG